MAMQWQCAMAMVMPIIISILNTIFNSNSYHSVWRQCSGSGGMHAVAAAGGGKEERYGGKEEKYGGKTERYGGKDQL